MAAKKIPDDVCLVQLQEKWMSLFKSRFDFFLNLTERENTYTESVLEVAVSQLSDMFNKYNGLKDIHFNKEILLDDNGQYAQRMAELLFYYQLLRMGFSEIKSENTGPDFFCQKNGRKYCFEVVTPTPSKKIIDLINKNELTNDEWRLVFKERLLAVTSSINRKIQDYETFKQKGIITGEEKYLIVVNDSLLLPYNKPWYGILNEPCIAESTLPIVVDATLGAGTIDFDLERYNATDNLDTKKSRKLTIKGNLSVSINQGPTISEDDSYLYLDLNNIIRTRGDTDNINVNIIESGTVSGFYQITLREDFFFFHVIPAMSTFLPKSALISNVTDASSFKKDISYRYFYSKNEDLVQPTISPTVLIGQNLDDFNNQLIYKNIYKRLE